MSGFYAKVRLKCAPQKLNMAMAKSYIKKVNNTLQMFLQVPT